LVLAVARGVEDNQAARIAELAAMVATLGETVEDVKREIAVRDRVIIDQIARIGELERALEESRRGGKRQAAPFSKGRRARHRSVRAASPATVTVATGTARRPFGPRTESWTRRCRRGARSAGVGSKPSGSRRNGRGRHPPVTPSVTKFKVAVGHCRDCGARVQGHHDEQTSDALGAAASQVGPVAKGWAMWLHYGLGLSFAKCTTVLARLGINVTAGAICSSSQHAATTVVAQRFRGYPRSGRDEADSHWPQRSP
jgi:transposase